MGAWRARPHSVRMRIMGFFLLLLAVVFLTVSVGFNLIMNSYIQNQATEQLLAAARSVSSDVLMPGGPPDGNGGRYGQRNANRTPNSFMQDVNRIARRGAFVAQVQALLVDAGYRQVYPDQADELDERNQQLLSEIGRQQLDLDSEAIREVKADARTYFVKALRVDGPQGEADDTATSHLLLFIDMTDVSNLVDSMNLLLVVIVLFATLLGVALALGMSARLVRPIRALSDFAEAIGRGVFKRRALPSMHDRELIELGDTMNRAAEQLDQYDREQKTFFQNASHELRTPLMSIKGYAEGIQVGVFEDAAQAAGVIVSEADHMSDMVEDLLYLSRIDSLTSSETITELDARELLSECGDDLSGVALHEGVAIAYDFPERPVLIRGNEKSLARAFTNVLGNALRYARSAVTVSCRAEAGRAVIRVADDGPGIAEDDLPRIFDRFYKGKGGKHGIGLSIAKTVIGQHKGNLRAENGEMGAEFTIELPLRPGAAGNT